MSPKGAGGKVCNGQGAYSSGKCACLPGYTADSDCLADSRSHN